MTMNNRSLSVAFVIAIFAVGINKHSCQTTQPSAFKLPSPSGPFGIGRVGYEWIDSSRPDRYSVNPGAHRDLMVYIWYPLSRSATGRREPYWPGAKEMDANPDIHTEMTEEFGTLWPKIVSGEFQSDAIENATVVKIPKRFPLVLFSHGLGGTSFEYTVLIEELVSRGYVVVAIEHTYTASAVVFPDGRVVVAHHDAMPSGLSPEEQWKRMGASIALGISEGAGDLIFVLNKLGELNQSGTQQFQMKGKLDLSRVAAAGHSAGGAFAARACQLDARIRACVSLDGEMPPVAAFPEYPDGKGFQQPVLLLEVDQAGKRMPFSLTQYNDFLKKEEAQLNMCPKGSYHVLLNAPGLFHGSFSDYRLRIASGNTKETAEALHNLSLTESFTRAFLDKYLKGAKAPQLDNSSQIPEAKVTRYGHSSHSIKSAQRIQPPPTTSSPL